MKAITLWQPWASFVADGEKKFETRSFKIKHRGLLAIHAAKTQIGLKKFYNGEDVGSYLPRGKIVCVVSLKAIFPTEKHRQYISPFEIRLGDWSNGRYAWALELKHKFKEPIPAIGRQGLWNIDTKLLIKELKP